MIRTVTGFISISGAALSLPPALAILSLPAFVSTIVTLFGAVTLLLFRFGEAIMLGMFLLGWTGFGA